MSVRLLRLFAFIVAAHLLLAGVAAAHGVSEGDRSFLMASQGAQLVIYLYLGAKHMVPLLAARGIDQDGEFLMPPVPIEED